MVTLLELVDNARFPSYLIVPGSDPKENSRTVVPIELEGNDVPNHRGRNVLPVLAEDFLELNVTVNKLNDGADTGI